MKALASLGTAAHAALAIVVAATTSGQSAYSMLFPSGPVSAQRQLDMLYHPYASVAGAMFPGIVGGFVFFAVLRWLAKKNERKISS